MAAKGTYAKNTVSKKIQEAFGLDWIGEHDKKLYIWADDGGEKVQIAISLTCPKSPVGKVDSAKLNFGGDLDIEEMGTETTLAQSTFFPAEITEEERTNIQELMEKLGL